MLTAGVSAQSVLGSRAICPFPIRGRRFHACCPPPALHASRAVNARAQITDAFTSRQWCLSNTQLIQTFGNEVLCRNRRHFCFTFASSTLQKRRSGPRYAQLAQQIIEASAVLISRDPHFSKNCRPNLRLLAGNSGQNKISFNSFVLIIFRE